MRETYCIGKSYIGMMKRTFLLLILINHQQVQKMLDSAKGQQICQLFEARLPVSCSCPGPT